MNCRFQNHDSQTLSRPAEGTALCLNTSILERESARARRAREREREPERESARARSRKSQRERERVRVCERETEICMHACMRTHARAAARPAWKPPKYAFSSRNISSACPLPRPTPAVHCRPPPAFPPGRSRHLLPRVGADALTPPGPASGAPWAYRFLSDRPSSILADRDAPGEIVDRSLRPSRGTWGWMASPWDALALPPGWRCNKSTSTRLFIPVPTSILGAVGQMSLPAFVRILFPLDR